MAVTKVESLTSAAPAPDSGRPDPGDAAGEREALQRALRHKNQEIQRLEAQLQHYQSEVEALRASKAWRVAAPLFAALRQVVDACRFLLLPFRLSSYRVIASSPGQIRAGHRTARGTLASEGKSGRVQFALPAPLAAGKYYFKLSYHSTQPLIGPALSVEHGEETEHSHFYIYDNYHKDQLSGFLELPANTRALWLSPSRVDNETELGSLRLRRVTWLNNSLYDNPWYWLPMMYGWGWMVESKKQEWRARWADLRHGYRKRDYATWWRLFGAASASELASQRARSREFTTRPLVSIILPVYNSDPRFLRQAIDSVIAQSYDNWQLCIADDCSTEPACQELLQAYAQQDPRVQLVFRPHNGHISAATNSAIELADGDYLALLDHDDMLAPQALYRMVETIAANPEVKLLYSDEDIIDADNQPIRGHFKPDWNPDFLRSINYICHLLVIDAALVREVGGMRLGYEGAQDYDLLLRVTGRLRPEQIAHLPLVLYHWRAVEGSTALDSGEKDYAKDAGLTALNAHLSELGERAKAQPSEIETAYRVVYPLPEPAPLVSIIIPTYNGVDILKNTVSSVLEHTDYPNYQVVIVDNRSDDERTLGYLDHLEAQQPRVSVLRYDQPFNFSAINNYAVSQVQGEVLLFLNNDIEVIDAQWLSEMTSHALRDGVGAVGAKLFFANGHMQHSGVILGIGPEAIAGHVYRGAHKWEVGDLARVRLTQNYSAVTAACLAIKRERFEQVGGFNQSELTVAFNDVDLCLKLVTAGYRNVWTPYAQLYHFESISRGYEVSPEKKARLAKEAAYMQRQWGPILRDDPHYNPNLTQEHENFGTAWPPRERPEGAARAEA